MAWTISLDGAEVSGDERLRVARLFKFSDKYSRCGTHLRQILNKYCQYGQLPVTKYSVG